ncbi:MAG: hypothetical protein ACOYL6_08480 [Bacteriovoracaceae bacterium]
MKLMLNQTQGRITLYYKKWHVMLYQLIIGLIALIMGLVFAIYISQLSKQQAFKWFGYFFSLVGIFLLSSLPRRYKKLSSSLSGDELVVISESEIKLSKGLGAEIFTYTWNQIEKIVVTKLYLDRDLDGAIKGKNYLIVFINKQLLPLDLVDRSKRGLNQNNRGEVYYTCPLPKNISAELFHNFLNSKNAGQYTCVINEIQSME